MCLVFFRNVFAILRDLQKSLSERNDWLHSLFSDFFGSPPFWWMLSCMYLNVVAWRNCVIQHADIFFTLLHEFCAT
jgi:hypothetical protein